MNTLRTNLKSEFSDIEIIRIYLETGNTSGTGNHVDCLSSIIFSAKMQEKGHENAEKISDTLTDFLVNGVGIEIAICRDRLKVRRWEHETFKNRCIRNFEVKIAKAYSR